METTRKLRKLFGKIDALLDGSSPRLIKLQGKLFFPATQLGWHNIDAISEYVYPRAGNGSRLLRSLYARNGQLQRLKLHLEREH